MPVQQLAAIWGQMLETVWLGYQHLFKYLLLCSTEQRNSLVLEQFCNNVRMSKWWQNSDKHEWYLKTCLL